MSKKAGATASSLFAHQLVFDPLQKRGAGETGLRLEALHGAVIAAQKWQASHVTYEDRTTIGAAVDGSAQDGQQVIVAGEILDHRIQHERVETACRTSLKIIGRLCT